MKKQILSEEFRRMQKLAGIQINESLDEAKKFKASDKAYGILFIDSTDPELGEYEWNEGNLQALAKSMGYKDPEAISDGITDESPGDEWDMGVIRRIEGNPNLQPEDLTIGMMIRFIEDTYPDKNEGDDIVKPKIQSKPELAALIEKYKDELIDKFGLDKSAVKVLDYSYYPEVGIGSPTSGFVKSVKFITPEDWEAWKKKYAKNEKFMKAKDIKIGGVDLKYYTN
jgi:hypothetical protein